MDQTTANTLLRQALADALGGCGITGGTLCAHIEPRAVHYGRPGRILQAGETCPLITPEDAESMAQSIADDITEITGPAIVHAHGVASAARKHLAEIHLSGTMEHPNRTAGRLGRYDGSF